MEDFEDLNVLVCTPPTPTGGWGTCRRCLHLSPHPQLNQKNVTKILYTKCFLQNPLIKSRLL